MWIFIHPVMVNHTFSRVPLQIRTSVSQIYCDCLQCTLAVSKRKCGKNCVILINYSQWLSESVRVNVKDCKVSFRPAIYSSAKAAPPALKWDSSCKGVVGKYFTCCRCFMHLLLPACKLCFHVVTWMLSWDC